MPELPEVETVKNNLNLFLPGKVLKKIKVTYPRTLSNTTEEILNRALVNKTFGFLDRKAKYLIFKFKENNSVLIVHLRMTGCFLIKEKEQEIPKHNKVIFEFFNSDSLLVFDDLRTFGKFSFYSSKKEAFQLENLNSLAPEPQNLKLSFFKEKLNSSHSKIKTLLLDQRKAVSGLGNIYTDEALFLSKIHPERTSSSLNSKEIKELYCSIKKTIQKSIKQGGTTINNYLRPNGELGNYLLDLNVYGRKDKACKVCSTKIIYMKVNQRGTHLCPNCQVK